MSDEIPLVKHDLETILEEMLQEARALKQRVAFLEDSKKEVSQLTDENKSLKAECEALQERFVNALIDSRKQDDEQNLQRLLDTYKSDLEKLKAALPQAKATEGEKKSDTGNPPGKA